VFLAPLAISPDAEHSEARLAVGGALTIGAIVGFVVNRPGRPIPENVEANEALRREAREQAEAVALENARRREDVRLVVRAREPVVREER
jgi:hypothetical protein